MYCMSTRFAFEVNLLNLTDLYLYESSIIGTLEKLKQEAADITQKVEETDAVMAEVEAVTDQYRPLAQSCSSIYFTMESLNLVSQLSVVVVKRLVLRRSISCIDTNFCLITNVNIDTPKLNLNVHSALFKTCYYSDSVLNLIRCAICETHYNCNGSYWGQLYTRLYTLNLLKNV